jgi:hypothetical protein
MNYFRISKNKIYPIARNLSDMIENMLVTLAAQSIAWTVFARSNAGIVSSNFTQGMNVRVRLFYVYVGLCR